MGKIKITIGLGKWTEGPQGEYKKLEIETPWDIIGAAPRIYDVAIAEVVEPGKVGSTGPYLIDQNLTIIIPGDIDNLVARLLTHVDATFTDKEQREAHKKLLRHVAWDWYNKYSPNRYGMLDD